MIGKAPLLLEGLRVLDFTEQEAMISGRILADLGADVIKIEKPGGSPSRIGPYYHDSAKPEESLPWFAYNLNKRGITLDIESKDGQELFRRLVANVDFVLETFPPGYLDKLDLGFNSLLKINPRIILASITPFGQTGPYSNYIGSELVCLALSGYLYVLGDSDRPPVWISYPQAYQHAGSEAAVGSLIAHWYREQTGEGQWVDVSVQDSAICPLMNVVQYWDMNRVMIKRAGPGWMHTNATTQMVFPCKDGYVLCHTMGGGDPAMRGSTENFREWLKEEGMAPEWLVKFDLATEYDAAKWTQELVDKVQEPFAKFILTKTKFELFEGAVKRGIILGLVSTAEDVFNNPQFKFRRLFTEIEHPELGLSIKYPSLGVMLNNERFAARRRPPLIGEHNKEIYQGELGLTGEQLALLKSAGII